MSIFNNDIQGNANVSRNTNVGGHVNVNGDAFIGHNLVVKGWLDAPNIKGPIKGLYASEASLKEAYPHPMPGWFALVGNTIPADVYRVDGGKWIPTGEKGGGFSLYLDQLESNVRDITDEVKDMKELLEGGILLENSITFTSTGAAAYMTFTVLKDDGSTKQVSKPIPIVDLKSAGMMSASDKKELSDATIAIRQLNNSIDELLKRMQGTSENSAPYADPFKLITFTNSESESGNAWNDFNSWLDGLHVDDGNPDYQKAGFFRVKLSGQYYEVVNYIVSWAEGWFIQVVFGHAKVSGSVIGSSSTYTILERSYKNGKWEDWTDRLEKNNVYQVPGNFDEVSTSATNTSSSAMQLGDASKLYEAITTGKVIKDENRVITNILLTSTNNEYALIYDHTTGYTSIFIRFSDNHQNYITISRLTINRIEDNLDSRSTQQALSANQGRILRDMIENIQINGGSVIIIE